MGYCYLFIYIYIHITHGWILWDALFISLGCSANNFGLSVTSLNVLKKVDLNTTHCYARDIGKSIVYAEATILGLLRNIIERYNRQYDWGVNM